MIKLIVVYPSIDQSLHLLIGFIGDPSGQLNARLNCGVLTNTPLARYLPGE